MSVKKAYLSLGSNLGEREESLARAIDALQQEGIQTVTRSSVYESEPRDLMNQPWFLNMVVACETRFLPIQLLAVLQRIERGLGRVRTGAVRRGPRVIDIDILLFGNTVMETSQLVIPHPRMFERRFVLEPLLEIAPDLRHPQTKEPLRKWLFQVAGQRVSKVTG